MHPETSETPSRTPGDACLLVMTDGRGEYLSRTLAEFDKHVTGPIALRVIHDDSGDPQYRDHLTTTNPGHEVISTGRRSGFAGAMRSAWGFLAAHVTEPWIFHLEDDFEFRRPTHLADLLALSEHRPHLAQVAYRRQPWNAEERAAGGFVEANPGQYEEHAAGRVEWLETARNFTTNPCLYRRSLCDAGWPDGAHSEGRFGFQLKSNGLPWGVPGNQVRFGFWGGLVSGREWVEHIGHVRTGEGY